MNERGCEAVGIDLGTTYSSLAYMDSQMMPRVMPDSSGQTVMPSVVFFDDEEVIVGDLALQQAKLCADRVAQFIKVYMGDVWRKQFMGVEHTPESISAIILGQLIREAEPQIGPVSQAVITVPAYFTEKRRRATQQAGEIAGLEVIGTLNEPMAATLAYGLHRTDREQLIVVYDLGGGTFDVTVVRISPNELEELATNGNRRLGGRDWDQALIDHVVEDFLNTHGEDLRNDVQAMQDLQLECEKVKRRLGRMARTTVRVPALGRDHRVELTRQEYEDLTAHLLQATRLTTEIALKDAGLTWNQIARVVLVGGSTHMPAVRHMLAETSGRPPETGVNPVIAVSLGAAIYAHMLETGDGQRAIHSKGFVEPEPTQAYRSEAPVEPRSLPAPPPPPGFIAPPIPPPIGQLPTAPNRSVPPIPPPITAVPPSLPESAPEPITGPAPTVRFVTAHGVGLKVRAGAGWANKVLIPKNTQVPVSITKRFLTRATGRGGRQIKINITQGDTSNVSLAEELGIGRIKGLPLNEPDGQPVDVTMEFDHQGRLHIHALYIPRDMRLEMTLDIPGGLEKEEIQQHRRFLESTGFLQRPPTAELVDLLEDVEDEDDEDIPFMEPID